LFRRLSIPLVACEDLFACSESMKSNFWMWHF
jgi:hypothetical protein